MDGNIVWNKSRVKNFCEKNLIPAWGGLSPQPQAKPGKVTAPHCGQACSHWPGFFGEN